MRKINILALAAAVLVLVTNGADAQSKAKEQEGSSSKKSAPQKFEVADGHLSFEASSKWKKVKPKINFIHAEFSIPKVDGDAQNGRITFSQVGGSIEQNLDRWVAQFKNTGNGEEDGVEKLETKVAGKTVHLIKISGTFMDGTRPFGPKTERNNYILMGAAIPVDGGNVYIKAYGPKKTIEQNHEALRGMLESMKVKED